jgi:hypothetical protein
VTALAPIGGARVAATALFAVALVVATVHDVAALTAGGGDATTDCLAEFGGTPANRPAANPRDIRCVDGDPTCDEDPELGVCRVRVEVCLNVTDPRLPGCDARALDSYFIANPQPDTNPLHDFDFQTLEDRLNFLTLPIEASDTNVCSGDVTMSVRLPIRPLVGGGRFRRGRKTIRATISGSAGASDADRLRITCAAADGTTPCDGLASTFEQIQRQIFTATCAVPTCHSVAQGEHDMSLAAGEAYASLVGVTPKNAAAAAAGKLRVDPGNPDNSFILDKLHGTLTAGEGARMPLDRDPLRSLNIQLIEEWIAAGAPASGFVSAVGCH